MNPNQALWEKGDFTRIAALMRDSGAAFARSLGPVDGLRVLDLGCGDGTTALPLAQQGAQVLGVDIARNLVAAGQLRAQEAGLERLQFVEGDACELAGLADASFDLAVSVFGAMFAPRPLDVARELVRVTRPGGRIVMGNWIPNDPDSFISQLLRVSASVLPPPPEGAFSPVSWGVEAQVLSRFAAAGIAAERIAMTRERWEFADPQLRPADLIGVFRRYYGPTMNAFAAAEPQGLAEQLQEQLVNLAEDHNIDTRGGTCIRASFLRVEVWC